MAVEAIHKGKAICLMTGGTIVPIATWLDDNGDDCEAHEAVVAVAGPDMNGKWHTLLLSEFDTVDYQ